MQTPLTDAGPLSGGNPALEIAELRTLLREATETLEAIRTGTVDSLIIGGPGEEQVYSLTSVDRSYRLIFDGMSEGAATISASGTILDANGHFTQMLGRPNGTLVGASAEDLATAPSRPVLARLLRVGTGESDRADLDLALPDGTALPVMISASGLRVEDTLLRCLVVTDLTARRRAERDLTDANDDLRRQTVELSEARDDALAARVEAEAATRAKSAFLAAMSHEIRTPMYAVIGLTGLLLETLLDPVQRDYLDTVSLSGDALLSIINDILDYSKIESGAMDLEQQPFDVRDLVEGAIDLVGAPARAKRLDLVVDIDSNCPHSLVGDVTRLRQVIVNLVGNAVKFTPSGDVTVTVGGTEAITGELWLDVAVTDTGIGIDAAKMDRLFRAFSQVEASTTRVYGGTGLGLAISARLVEAMGGRIKVESEPGVGSTFSFSIPTTRHDDAGPDQHTESGELAGLHVLVVDDNPSRRQIVQRQLEAWGSTSDAADSGAVALELARKRHVDAAIVDMDMSDAEGGDLSVALRELPGYRRLPLVLLSLTATRENRPHDSFAAELLKPTRMSKMRLALVNAVHGTLAPSQPLPLLRTEQPADVGLRVLLVEDNAFNQKVGLLLLGRVGCRPDVASDGVEALAALRRCAYDIVLMDVQMPEMDGLEASRQIRTTFAADRQPAIVAMTANAMAEDRRDCLQAGMDDYLVKPFRIEQLAAVLAKWGPSGPEARFDRMTVPV